MEKMKFMTMKVGEQPELKEYEIEQENDTYEIVRTAVGGYIEALRLSDTCTLWINEEGKINELEPNFILTDRAGNQVDFVVGDVIFTGVDEEGYTVGLSQEDIELIQERFTDRFHMKFYA
jgi:hypothetical protein